MDVIKIGGSIIFDKKGNVKTKIIEKIFKKLAKTKNKKIIVIGCGKKQHEFTFKNNLTDKPKKKNGKIIEVEKRYEKYLENFNLIEKNISKVNKIASKYLKITPINPVHLILKKSKGSTKKHEIVWFNEKLIENNKTPLISGGIIPDKEIMFSAVSSDTIAAYLAKHYKAERLIILTDVDGIYDKNKKTIKKLNFSKIKKEGLTGGMADKIRRIKPSITSETKIYIANGTNEKRLNEIIINKKYENCTEVI